MIGNVLQTIAAENPVRNSVMSVEAEEGAEDQT
jgi:hypothetical protein